MAETLIDFTEMIKRPSSIPLSNLELMHLSKYLTSLTPISLGLFLKSFIPPADCFIFSNSAPLLQLDKTAITFPSISKGVRHDSFILVSKSQKSVSYVIKMPVIEGYDMSISSISGKIHPREPILPLSLALEKRSKDAPTSFSTTIVIELAGGFRMYACVHFQSDELLTSGSARNMQQYMVRDEIFDGSGFLYEYVRNLTQSPVCACAAQKIAV